MKELVIYLPPAPAQYHGTTRAPVVTDKLAVLPPRSLPTRRTRRLWGRLPTVDRHAGGESGRLFVIPGVGANWSTCCFWPRTVAWRSFTVRSGYTAAIGKLCGWSNMFGIILASSCTAWVPRR